MHDILSPESIYSSAKKGEEPYWVLLLFFAGSAQCYFACRQPPPRRRAEAGQTSLCPVPMSYPQSRSEKAAVRWAPLRNDRTRGGTHKQLRFEAISRIRLLSMQSYSVLLSVANEELFKEIFCLFTSDPQNETLFSRRHNPRRSGRYP